MIKSIIKKLMDRTGITISNLRSNGNHSVYLTFDDGPHPVYTTQILELLDVYNAKATFFLVGEQAAQHPHIVRKILAAGHTIGNHSYYHTRFGKLSLRKKLSEISMADRLLSEIMTSAGKNPNRIPFRPPQGIITPGLIYYAFSRNRSMYMWSVDSGDYKTDCFEKKLEYLKSKTVSPGDIILFHDDNELTLELLRHFMPIWRESGLLYSSL